MAAENPSHIKMINILTKSFELSNMKPSGMSGIELHAHLIEQGQLMPTIFMSGEYLPHELAAIEATGCVEFLNKPFGMNPLLSAVEKAFALISP